jgi:hypothetical protein
MLLVVTRIFAVMVSSFPLVMTLGPLLKVVWVLRPASPLLKVAITSCLIVRPLVNRSIVVSLAALIISHFIADLATHLASTKLSLRLKSVVPVYANWSAIYERSVKQLYGICCFFTSGILDKTKSAGLHLLLVQAHHKIDYLATLVEYLDKLGFQGEE